MQHNPHCMNPAHYGMSRTMNLYKRPPGYTESSIPLNNPRHLGFHHNPRFYGQPTDAQTQNLQKLIMYLGPVLMIGGVYLIFQEFSNSKSAII